MLANILAVLGILLLLAGALKRRLSWSRGAIVAGVLLLIVGFVLGGGIQGFLDGWRAAQ